MRKQQMPPYWAAFRTIANQVYRALHETAEIFLIAVTIEL